MNNNIHAESAFNDRLMLIIIDIIKNCVLLVKTALITLSFQCKGTIKTQANKKLRGILKKKHLIKIRLAVSCKYE